MSPVHLLARYTNDAELLLEVAIECALSAPHRGRAVCPF